MKKLIDKIPNTVLLKNFFSQRQLSVVNQHDNNSFKQNPLMLKAFTLADLNPVPKKWSIGEPDFVGLGIQKAGTSWWFSLLLEHPQVVHNRLNKKELHYFNHFHFRGLEPQDISVYRQAFAKPEGGICGEWSPSYLYNPFVVQYLAKTAPKTKILILLRNPVDRVLSGLNQTLLARLKYFNFTSEQSYVYELFYLYPEAINRSLYSKSLKQLLHYFNRDQILLLQYEKCQANPYKEISRTYQFLGINETYRPKNIKQSINKRNYLMSNLKLEERQYLAEYFSDDVYEAIKLFPEINLALWKDFNI